MNGHNGGHPTERHDSSAARQGSRDRTTDRHETQRDDERSILTPISSITIATASATTAIKTATSEAAGTSYPRLGFVHRETTPVVILIMEPLDRCLSLGVGVHLDKTEPFAAPRFPV